MVYLYQLCPRAESVFTDYVMGFQDYECVKVYVDKAGGEVNKDTQIPWRGHGFFCDYKGNPVDTPEILALAVIGYGLYLVTSKGTFDHYHYKFPDYSHVMPAYCNVVHD